jgi:hypothetical protein
MIPELKYFTTKYPDIVKDEYIIDIIKLSNLIVIARQHENDIETLKKLGLEYFLIDLQYLFGNVKQQRKLKLKKLNRYEN